jgi:cyclophilin family peptidyl-prolyl cis-trans isomerase
MILNINLNHFIIGILSLYILYTNYQKFFKDDKINFNNLIKNFQELLFSKKIKNKNEVNDIEGNITPQTQKSISRLSMDNEEDNEDLEIELSDDEENNYDYKDILNNINIDFDNIPGDNYVYFNVGTKDKNYGSIIFKLYDDICPVTSNNFRKLAVKSPIEEDEQSAYAGCMFFRIVKNFMIQTGDFENNDGSGGVSIYGKYFEDEDLTISLNKPGLLVMANKGPDTNNSQFFITTSDAQHLDGKHVVFGEVIYGMNIIKTIEDTPVNEEYKPSIEIYITKSGLLLPTF